MFSSSAAPLVRGPANFTGNFLLDVEASDSLEPLLAYHRIGGGAGASAAPGSVRSHSQFSTLTTSNGNGVTRQLNSQSAAMGMGGVGASLADPSAHSFVAASASGAASSLSAVSESSDDAFAEPVEAVQPVPALIVQHSIRRLTTYVHSLLPRYAPNGELIRYDPLHTGSKLPVHEDYKLDGEYHPIATPRGMVEARAYVAPHGQSVIVDTRCRSKYDLERTERFFEDGGKTLILEVRILSCSPEVQPPPGTPAAAGTLGVSKRFLSDPVTTPDSSKLVAGGQMRVVETLFLRRVFRRILDAAPAGAAPDIVSSAPQSLPPHVRLPAFGSNANVEEERVLVERLNFDAVADSASSAGHATSNGSASSSASSASFLPPHLASEAVASPSLWSRFRDAVLYPRHYVLRSYPLADLLPDSHSAASKLPASTQAAISAEHSAYSSARVRMFLVDLLLLALVFVFLGLHFGWFSEAQLQLQLDRVQEVVSEGVIEGVAAVKAHMPQAHSTAVEISNVAVTLTPAPPPLDAIAAKLEL